MNNGEVIRFVLGDAGAASVEGAAEQVDVDMNEFGASKDSPVVLFAGGGPCPVIVFYDSGQQLGALVHIDGGNAEQDGDDHEELLAQLLAAAPELDNHAPVYICFDPSPAPGLQLPNDMDEQDLEDQVEKRLAYVQKVTQFIQERGFNNVMQITDGLGKYVCLNTADGVLMVLDQEENLVFPAAGGGGA